MGDGITPQEVRADGARAADDVTWDETRTILHNGSFYASLPAWAVRDLGLDDDGAEFVPGYSPAGQAVLIEQAAIIIRVPEGVDEQR